MQIVSMVPYHLPFKRFLANISYRLLPPIRRLGRVRTRVLSYYITSKFSILQSANANQLLEDKVKALKEKMELHEINSDDSCVPGYFSHLFCPKCKGGKSMERSLSLHIIQDADFAMWRCYHTSCGWAGQIFADGRETNQGINKKFKVISSMQMTAESTVLEPLGEKLIAYFADRMISEETINRNAVMQIAGDKDVIAFTYIHNGMLVGCKYRTMEKKFWQDKGTGKWLYGLDDINEASEIIIVEGEIDKLSVEEAGFRNCVSVPGGAPLVVSAKELPALENDRAYQYLWNCKEYLDKISRIVLATDGDLSGQALAEELARRLGKERCWVVRWPKKDESSCFKDANEVLKSLGAIALKQVIESAELYNRAQAQEGHAKI
ncbi:primase homolog protein [Euphorbia lathyris]|uniref:primase homolog protein n=1 Tax=Euphorbia lathyris TaxID=212925 RepID=UPI0033140AC0